MQTRAGRVLESPPCAAGLGMTPKKSGHHASSCCCCPAQAELKEKLASSYDVKDPQAIFLFGFRTQVRECAGECVILQARAVQGLGVRVRAACPLARSLKQHLLNGTPPPPVRLAVRWRQVHRLWAHLRQHPSSQAVRAQVPPDQGACWWRAATPLCSISAAKPGHRRNLAARGNCMKG